MELDHYKDYTLPNYQIWCQGCKCQDYWLRRTKLRGEKQQVGIYGDQGAHEYKFFSFSTYEVISRESWQEHV